MPAQRRKFNLEEKMNILQEAMQMGVTAVLHKYNLSYSVFYRWKQKMTEDRGTVKRSSSSSSRDDIKAILEENAMLKKIVANLALELEMKNAYLNKSGDHPKK